MHMLILYLSAIFLPKWDNFLIYKCDTILFHYQFIDNNKYLFYYKCHWITTISLPPSRSQSPALRKIKLKKMLSTLRYRFKAKIINGIYKKDSPSLIIWLKDWKPTFTICQYCHQKAFSLKWKTKTFRKENKDCRNFFEKLSSEMIWWIQILSNHSCSWIKMLPMSYLIPRNSFLNTLYKEKVRVSETTFSSNRSKLF
jgi:hypothetical protein